MAEFLPLCDVLFNVISLAGYFCDVVFDVVMGYALLERGYKGSFAAAISIVATSLVISQVISLRWYLQLWNSSERKGRPPWLTITLHCLQVGVLWRYARLLVPVELTRVKHQVRDLCMLRLVHAFCEAAPMLLLQLHILLREEEPILDITHEPAVAGNKTFSELCVISSGLSLFSMCWALASFSKNVRLNRVHRLVLTWLGVAAQFLWRLGTVSARVCALTVYALVYEYWVFLVIGLHWLSMFLWLLSPGSALHSERLSRLKKTRLAALVAVVYVFAYVNLHDGNHRQKMVTFYVVMCIENGLLICAVWWSGRGMGPQAATTAAAAFSAGLVCMLLYYRYFHVRRLDYMLGDNQQGTNSTNASSQNKNGKAVSGADNAAIPGVFNCRFANPVNSANARKKKKPTSFVPPPGAPPPGAPPPGAPPPHAAQDAFWRRPLPAHHHHGGSSENEGSSVGSRVNIQQKLQEKKQKQLAELRVIEEEIKQGKLTKTTPVAVEEIYSSLQRQPIPRAKTHAEPLAWPSIEVTHPYQNYPVLPGLPHNCNIYPTYTEIKQEFNQNFANETPNVPDLKIRLKYDQNGTFYENPVVLRSENRTPIRSPKYLMGENRTYDKNCASPRNILNTSPRTYNIPDVTPSYETNMDKPRVPQNGNIYSEDHRKNLGEYSGYGDNNQTYQYDSKDEYVAALQNALANVQSIDNIRSSYEATPNIPNQYGQSSNQFRTNDNQFSQNNNQYGQTESQFGQNGTQFGQTGSQFGQNGSQFGQTGSQFSQNSDRFPYLGGKKDLSRKFQRCRTPEILLAPHYLEGCNRQVCWHWGPPYTNRKKEEGAGSSGEESNPDGAARETPRPPSDIDSQISLPRSYTLPREFRYWRRRARPRDACLPSNNSSDGDVDSGDESDRISNRSLASGRGLRAEGRSGHSRPPPRKYKPETKL